MCMICGEIAGDSHTDLIADLLGGEYTRPVLNEFEQIAVLPSVGPVLPGHVLLCPSRHSNRIAALTQSEARDLSAAKQWVTKEFRLRYDSAAQFFEHGASADGGHVPCTVDHAHLHAVPYRRLWNLLPAQLNWTPVSNDVASLSSLVGEREYLYYEDDDGNAVAASNDTGTVESQLLRRIIANDVGEGETWNWRDHPNVERMSATIATLKVEGRLVESA